ncbi:MAG: MFS transporter [Mediterranea sp.]|nr:MFS transporter [Mediterranea sp.]
MKNSKVYPWVVVGLLWVVALLNYMDRQMLSTMQEAMGHDIVELQNAEAFGFLMSVFLWIYAVMSPVSGVIGDRLNRKWLIVGSLFVWSSVTLAMGFANSYHQILVLRAVMGISEALYMPAALSLIADYHQGKSCSLAVGIHMTGLYCGQAVGGFGATVAAAWSWHTAFLGFGLVGVVYSLILIAFLHDKSRGVAPSPAQLAAQQAAQQKVQQPKESIWRAFPILFSSLAFGVILFYFAVLSLPGWATKNWLPTLFANSLDIPMSQAGPMSTITIAFSSFLGVIIGGVMSDRWVKVNLRGRVYTSAIGLSLTIPSLVLLGTSHDIVGVVSAGLLFGIGYGMFDTNNMPILCQFVSSKYRATAYGIMNMTGVVFGAIVTQLLGKLKDGGMDLGVSFACMGAVVAVAVILQLLFLKPKSDNME